MKKNQLTFAVILGLLFTASCFGQEDKKDPATETDIIQETLGKIREVENLDKYISENASLKQTNQQLTQQVQNLTKQVNELTQKLATENERMRKQLLQLPTFDVKAKLVGSKQSMAVLQLADKPIRIRSETEMSVPVANGVWTLMRVEKITKDFIELTFPELDRTIIIYD